MDKPKKSFGGRQDGAGRPAKPESEKLQRIVLYASPRTAGYLTASEIEDEDVRKKVARERSRYMAAHLDVYVVNKLTGNEPHIV